MRSSGPVFAPSRDHPRSAPYPASATPAVSAAARPAPRWRAIPATARPAARPRAARLASPAARAFAAWASKCRDAVAELRHPGLGLGVGAPPLAVGGVAHLVLDGAQPGLERPDVVAGDLADRLPALLDRAQRGTRGGRVGDVDLFGLGEQRSLGLGVGRRTRRPVRRTTPSAREERVLRGPEALPQRVVGVLVGAARRPSTPPSGRGSGRRSGPSRRSRRAPRPPRPAPPCACLAPARWRSRSAKCDPRRRLNASRALENRFQSSSSVLRSIPRIVRHSSRIALNRSPACFHWVASAASCSASAASSSLRATAAVRWASRAARARERPPIRRGRSARRGGRGGRRGRRRRSASARPSRIARAEPRACLGSPPAVSRWNEELDLGGHVVEPAREVGEALVGGARLPRADHALAVAGADVDHALGVDPAPRVTGRRRPTGLGDGWTAEGAGSAGAGPGRAGRGPRRAAGRGGRGFGPAPGGPGRGWRGPGCGGRRRCVGARRRAGRWRRSDGCVCGGAAGPCFGRCRRRSRRLIRGPVPRIRPWARTAGAQRCRPRRLGAAGVSGSATVGCRPRCGLSAAASRRPAAVARRTAVSGARALSGSASVRSRQALRVAARVGCGRPRALNGRVRGGR